MGVRLACATAASMAVSLMAPDGVSACVHRTLSRPFPRSFLPVRCVSYYNLVLHVVPPCKSQSIITACQ